MKVMQYVFCYLGIPVYPICFVQNFYNVIEKLGKKKKDCDENKYCTIYKKCIMLKLHVLQNTCIRPDNFFLHNTSFFV